MINQQVRDYISSSRAAGMSDADIKKSLIDSGWPESDVNNGLSNQDKSNNSESFVLPGVFKIIAESFGIYKSNILKLLVLGSLSLPVYIASIFLDPGYSVNSDIGFSPILLIVSVLSGLLSLISFIAINSSILNRLNNETISQSIVKALKVFIPVLGLIIILSILIFFGTLALIIPGIILMTWYSQALLVKIKDGTGLFKSMSISKSYVKGSSLAVFYRILLSSLVFGLISIAISILLGSLISLELVTALVQIIIMPISYAFNVRLYEYLKEAHSSNIVIGNKGAGKILLISLLVVLVIFASLGFLAYRFLNKTFSNLNINQTSEFISDSDFNDTSNVINMLEAIPSGSSEFKFIYRLIDNEISSCVAKGEIKDSDIGALDRLAYTLTDIVQLNQYKKMNDYDLMHPDDKKEIDLMADEYEASLKAGVDSIIADTSPYSSAILFNKGSIEFETKLSGKVRLECDLK